MNENLFETIVQWHFLSFFQVYSIFLWKRILNMDVHIFGFFIISVINFLRPLLRFSGSRSSIVILIFITQRYPCPTLIIPILPNIILILKPLLKDLNNARDTCDIRSEENFFPLIPRPRKRSRSTVSRYRRGRTMIFQSKVIAKRPSQRKVCEQRNWNEENCFHFSLIFI